LGLQKLIDWLIDWLVGWLVGFERNNYLNVMKEAIISK
jgi:hypothetical protein